jgi:hypothetical protein
LSGTLFRFCDAQAIRDCLVEIAVLHDIAARMTLEVLTGEAIARRAPAHAIQTISEAVRDIRRTGLRVPDGAMGAN